MAIQPTTELIRAIQNYKQGQPQAFETLYNLSLPYLTKCVLNVINRTAPGADETLLQDILQDTYLSIAEKLDTLQNEEAFFQWAGQIATNHALRTWNKAVSRQEMEQPEDDMVYELADEAFIPEDILENKEKQQLIRKMLQELPTPQYLCLVEHFYNGLKEREIAEKLDMPLGTVKTNLSRAKKKLKEIVETHEKKHGIKLYSMSALLVLLLWKDATALVINPKAAAATLSAVGAKLTGSASIAGATGTAGTVSAAGASGVAGTAAAAGAASTASATVGTAIGAKIVASVVAASLVLGGTGLAIYKAQDKPSPTVSQTIPVTEVTVLPEETLPSLPTVSDAPTVGDVVLTANDLDYINRVINSMQLGVVPYGPLVPYQKENNFLNITPYVVNCAGTEGLLKGTPTRNGLQVTKADLEAFMMDTLGCVQEIVTNGVDDVWRIDENTFLIENYQGDKAVPISIHNIAAVNTNQITVIALKDYTTYACTFERSATSKYGWILTSATDRQEKQSTCMSSAVFASGVVLPENGANLLVCQPPSEDAAIAYVRQYLWETTGNIPPTITVDKVSQFGLADSYFWISCRDESGALLHTLLFELDTSKLYSYDPSKQPQHYDPQRNDITEISWKPGN